MRRIPLVLVLMLLIGPAAAPTKAAEPYQQGVQAPETASYTISARLDPTNKTVVGSEQIRYVNRSSDQLHELYLRLYLRAFRSMDTLWMRESDGNSRGFKINPNELGDITVSTLTLADGQDLLATSSLSDTLLHVPLAQVLAPGQEIVLNATWTSKLPRVFARTGYGGKNDTFFMVGQWYPKMAVYDRGQWDTEPWHANAEFFNDFGKYAVTIDTPANYVVAGVGVPDGPPQVRGDRAVVQYTAQNVTDFAFAASPDFRTQRAEAGAVEIMLYYLPEHETSVHDYLNTAVATVTSLSRWFGQYPHPRLTVVDVPESAEGAGGMEYPSLITGGLVGGPSGSGLVAYVTAHEIGHQWWPMQTATNEAVEPWLDEGLTEYSGARANDAAGDRIGFGPLSISPPVFELLNYTNAPSTRPLDRPAWEYSGNEYASLIYAKTALGLWTLERTVGTARFQQAMAAYLQAYRFKHPTTREFRASIEGALGPQAWFFDEYAQGGEIGYSVGPIAADGKQVVAQRTGNVRAPVDVQIRYASGRSSIVQWDGQATTHTIVAENGERIVAALIDPARKLVAERAIGDNGTATEIQVQPAAQIGARLLFLFQTLAQLFAMIG